MKLRIHGNSVRIRVTKSDIDTLRRQGRLEASLAVGIGQKLAYSLVLRPATAIEATMTAAGGLSVHLPDAAALAWFDSDREGLTAVQENPGLEPLEIIVEKDFTCLVPREGEDQSDYFANPAAAGNDQQ